MKLRRILPVIFTIFVTTCIALPVNFEQNIDASADESVNVSATPHDEAGWNMWANYWQSFKSFVHEKKIFIAEFWNNRHQVGSLTPSSKYLAKAMTRSIKYSEFQPQTNILEVGAGTGIFTKYVIKRMNRRMVNFEFDVVEIDPKFCDVLVRNMTEEFGDLSKDLPNVHFLCRDITKFETNKQYDFIVSGLPFHSFDPELVGQILEMYTKLIKPGGTVTFFEYIAIQTLKKPFLTDEEQIKLKAINDLIKIFRCLGKTTSESIVWMNILPARVISVAF